MTNYKTEKRKAAVGERILITDAGITFGGYENGDVMTVSDLVIDDYVYVEEQPLIVNHKEYEVIVEEAATDHRAQATAAVAELIAQAYDEGYKDGKAGKSPLQKVAEDNHDKLYEVARKSVHRKPTAAELAAEQQAERDRVVAQAKADVAELAERAHNGNGHLRDFPTVVPIGHVDVKFVVNREKRAVVALLSLRYMGDGTPVRKGIAKCDPDDCFNAHIGKAIALRRALGLEVPAEYLNAPAPTEVRVGDVVLWKSVHRGDTHTTVTEMTPHNDCERYGKTFLHTAYAGYIGDKQIAGIIDDSRETTEGGR